MSKTSKGWIKELIRRGSDIVFLMDETVNSRRSLASKSRRYWGKSKDNKRVCKTYQVIGKFHRLGDMLVYAGEGYIRQLDKPMRRLKLKEIDDFVKAFRDLEGDQVELWADNRPLTALCAKYRDDIQIKSKRLTQRIDAIFGFKRVIYKLLRDKEIKGFEEFNIEYLRGFDNLGLKHI